MDFGMAELDALSPAASGGRAGGDKEAAGTRGGEVASLVGKTPRQRQLEKQEEERRRQQRVERAAHEERTRNVPSSLMFADLPPELGSRPPTAQAPAVADAPTTVRAEARTNGIAEPAPVPVSKPAPRKPKVVPELKDVGSAVAKIEKATMDLMRKEVAATIELMNSEVPTMSVGQWIGVVLLHDIALILLTIYLSNRPWLEWAT